MARDTKRKLYPRTIHFFVIVKYVEDVKQDEKSVPDLVKSIMKGSGRVKEELWRNFVQHAAIQFQMTQIRSKIKEFGVSTFWMSGNLTDSRRRPTQLSRPVSFNVF